MKTINTNSNIVFRIVCLTLTAVLLLGAAPVFAGAKANLQGGSLYFDQLIETKEESIIRTKVSGNQAQDVSQKINVEYIKTGSEIVLTAENDFNGTIVGTVTRNELNAEGTRIAKSSIEATMSGEKIYAGKSNVDGVTAGQSIGIFFDNDSLPGAKLGDSKALYELQLLFTPKNQKPFYYTYYIRLVGDEQPTTPEISENLIEEPKEEPKEEPTATTPTNNNTTQPNRSNAANNTTPVDTAERPATATPSQNTTHISTASNANKNMAMPSSTKVAVNGQIISCEVYEISDYNYFKLRDFAAALNGTNKSFSVSWQSENGVISLHTRAPYQAVGGELSQSENYLKGVSLPITPLQSSLLCDNTTVWLDGYIIKSNTYFKVRDLAELIGASVTYDSNTDTMHITAN